MFYWAIDSFSELYTAHLPNINYSSRIQEWSEQDLCRFSAGLLEAVGKNMIIMWEYRVNKGIIMGKHECNRANYKDNNESKKFKIHKCKISFYDLKS